MLVRHTPFRIPPVGPPSAYRTFGVSWPTSSTRPASCAEVDCEHHRRGWTTTVDETTDLGAAQAYHIRNASGRGFVEHRDPDGKTVFAFHPGQECFRRSTHRISIRPPTLTTRHGDWRGNPTGWSRVHTRVEDWVEDWASHQDHLRSLRGRG